MNKSPGHQKWPDHEVREERVEQRYQVRVKGTVVVDSADVIRLEEDEHPPRLYFRRSDVRATLRPTETTSECPFKGTARYFALEVGEDRLEDAVWSYEEPYEEHRALKDRVAFYNDKFAEISVAAAD